MCRLTKQSSSCVNVVANKTFDCGWMLIHYTYFYTSYPNIKVISWTMSHDPWAVTLSVHGTVQKHIFQIGNCLFIVHIVWFWLNIRQNLSAVQTIGRRFSIDTPNNNNKHITPYWGNGIHSTQYTIYYVS